VDGEFWTIHVWTARPGGEVELADAWERMAQQRLAGSGGSALSLFRVSDDPRVHYTPMRWESRAAYDAWRDGDGRAAMDAVDALCTSVQVVPLDTALVVRR
jgi:heme-degrading monooxygenase HmoA